MKQEEVFPNSQQLNSSLASIQSNRSQFLLTDRLAPKKTEKGYNLLKLSCFEEDSLLKAIFEDNSSLIVHPDFQFITYFHYDNTMITMKTDSLTRRHNVINKVYAVINIYNQFTHSVAPITHLFEGFNTEMKKNNNSSSIKLYWFCNDSSFEKEDEYFYSVYSHNKEAKVSLLLNSKLVHVTYNQPLISDENGLYYYKATKIFPIDNLASIWSIPVRLLINHFSLEINFSQSILNTLVVDYRSVITTNEYMTIVPIIDSPTINDGATYLSDESNPLVFIFSNKRKLRLLYTQTFTYLVEDKDERDGELKIVNNYNLQLCCSTSGKLTSLIHQEETCPGEFAGKKYDIRAYLRAVSKIDEDTSCDIFELCNEIIGISKYKTPLTSTTSSVQKRQPLFENNEFQFDGDEVLERLQQQGVGEFTSFKNKAIRVRFIDRTTIKTNSNFDQILLMTSDGERFFIMLNNLDKNLYERFFFYLDQAKQFYNYSFMNKNGKIGVDNQLDTANQIVFDELKKIDVFKEVENGKLKSTSNTNLALTQVNQRKFETEIKETGRNTKESKWKETKELDIEKILKSNDEFLSSLRDIR